MYFPAPDDVPPSPFRTPGFTTHFPRLTSLARNLLSDEGYDLPFHFRLGHANVSSSPAYPLSKTELLMRKRGKNSARLVFSHTTPTNSRLVFGMNGVGQLEGELFSSFAAGAAEEEEATAAGVDEPASHVEDGRGVRWGYDAGFEAVNNCPAPSYIDFFWEHSYHISTNNYLRGGFVVGGMLPGSMLPFAFDAGGVDLGATLQAVRGPWALGMDCQVRTMWLDLTGGRCFLNSVVAYQKPTFALTMNMHGFGERFIASAVANPVGLYRAFCKTNTAKDEDLYNCTWLAENKIKFDILNLGVGNNAYRLSVHSSSLVRLYRNTHVKLSSSLQADVLPFDPNTARIGLSLVFVV
ncbi:uncharacterized protein ACA1_287790 [Acanthamoeba castellanii str. Neff]|uniref:Uncharacterized protein n=1 Tax=Acanthamoeba castellanii (strain ATCC 30010 / Neff) TaxID=1257118 RepID=L8HK95_ACACF|nr:uncharacterized protein ACA1_287790 [Acanthamoeba castellanii str. Neff]ELR25078.1 hypothetical protein ACA1_287790 [Acanthamoeba castellanii str. Neff]